MELESLIENSKRITDSGKFPTFHDSEVLFRNGAGNWNKDFRKMLDTLLSHFASGAALNASLLNEAEVAVKQIRPQGDGDEEINRLCKLAVNWVALNPKPVPLNETDYDR